ncbi:MAG TPA: NADPH-dependent 7-cyano-7-deazaguanine reductase QueF [Euryarchaeota archaeon]|nr:MAG: preQ(1) synthase [Thermoplasmata archaeon]RLF69792.1 MAG: preQ(1) synthase [Thermoplasmata archaeon]RLF73169.1 MAG: preQ(1) synthase [Thermoplasmata archaeon]HDD60302.1 NADPH-dependent 7-cyano-7-deazaguanine reductase QueF [Euryarchaeota archaeon]
MDEKRKLLKVIENRYSSKHFVAEHTTDELTAVCPTTSLPDFYSIRIVYEPDKYLIELKSLKFYFNSFRNEGIYHEELINRVVEDFIEVVKPRWLFVELKVKVRGGIYTTVRRFWSREGGDDIKRAIEGVSFNPSEEPL